MMPAQWSWETIPPRQVDRVNVGVLGLYSERLRKAAVGFYCSASPLRKHGLPTVRADVKHLDEVVRARNDRIGEFIAARKAMDFIFHSRPDLRSRHLAVNCRTWDLDRVVTKKGSTHLHAELHDERHRIKNRINSWEGTITCTTWFPERRETDPKGYNRVLGALFGRLRHQLGPGALDQVTPRLWVDCHALGRATQEHADGTGKRPSLLEAMTAHLKTRGYKTADIAAALQTSPRSIHNAWQRYQRRERAVPRDG